jgi:hypothetical protein
MYLEAVSWDLMAGQFLAFSGIYYIMVVLICIPTNSLEGSCFTASLLAFIIFAFKDGHSNYNEMKS